MVEVRVSANTMLFFLYALSFIAVFQHYVCNIRCPPFLLFLHYFFTCSLLLFHCAVRTPSKCKKKQQTNTPHSKNWHIPFEVDLDVASRRFDEAHSNLLRSQLQLIETDQVLISSSNSTVILCCCCVVQFALEIGGYCKIR